LQYKILAALRFPRQVAEGSIELQDCPHDGSFDPQDPQCLGCRFGGECEWLLHHDRYVDLVNKPLPDLVEALEFGIGYVDALVTRWGHNQHTCQCDACVWLRDARRLHNKAVTYAL
jgi:hypothetical protein